jgi:hypothetical protein
MNTNEAEKPFNEQDGNRAYIALEDFYSDREEYLQEIKEIYDCCKEEEGIDSTLFS